MGFVNYFQVINFLKNKEKIIFKDIIKSFCILKNGEGHNNKNIFIRYFFINGKKEDIIFRYNNNSTDQQKIVYEYKKLKFLNGRFSPKPYYISDKSKNFFKKNILVLEYLDKPTIKPNLFSKKEIRLLAKTLAALHKIIFNKFSINSEFPPLGRGNLKNLLIQRMRVLENFFIDSNIHFKNRILTLFYLTRNELVPRIDKLRTKRFSFIHGDLRDHFIKKGNKFYLIDWEASGSGDAAEDMAHFLYFSKLPKLLKKYFIKQYLNFRFRYRNRDKEILERIKIYIILEEFAGLKWSWEQAKSKIDKNERYFYRCLYKIRYENLIKACQFFKTNDYYLTAGHLKFL